MWVNPHGQTKQKTHPITFQKAGKSELSQQVGGIQKEGWEVPPRIRTLQEFCSGTVGRDGGIRRSKDCLQVAYSLNKQTDFPLQQVEEGSLRSRTEDVHVDPHWPAGHLYILWCWARDTMGKRSLCLLRQFPPKVVLVQESHLLTTGNKTKDYLSSELGAWKWVWQPFSGPANPGGTWGLHSVHSVFSAFCLTTGINSHYKRRKLNWTVLSNFVCKGSRPWAVTKGWDTLFSRYISKKMYAVSSGNCFS